MLPAKYRDGVQVPEQPLTTNSSLLLGRKYTGVIQW